MSHAFADESPEQRLAMARIIERAVRPVRATSSYKRKIREELLAHLISIYHEEKQNTSDPAAAIANTAKRFGDPIALSHQLDAAVPASKRFDYYFERLFAWRAPESGTYYAFRMSFRMACLALIPFAIVLIVKLFDTNHQWVTLDETNAPITLRTLVSLLVMLPVAFFLLMFLYFKIRDSIFGVFGSPKSLLRAAIYSCLCFLTVFPLVVFDTLVEWNFRALRESFPPLLFAGLAFSVIMPLIARLNGPRELDETFWATLEI